MLNKQALLINNNTKKDYTPFYVDFGTAGGGMRISYQVLPSFYISYNGVDWSDQTYGADDIIEVSSGRVYFKAVESTNSLYNASDYYNAWTISGNGVKLGGNINSLLSADNPNSVAIGQSAFAYMFGLNNAILDASELVLPAKVANRYAYAGMFYGCAALGTSPIIQAESISSYGCNDMFYGCSGLTCITCLAVQLYTNACKTWVDMVALDGTFYKNSANSTWQRGINGIPRDWVIKDYN